MIFSILICSLHDRKSLLKRLLSLLNKQIISYDKDVEILINIDNGEQSIGKKRNQLLQSAKGEYIAFIDDDDLVSKKYIQLIVPILKNNNVDCIGFKGEIIIDNRKKHTFIHSLKYKTWFDQNGIKYRCPNHLNPIKRDLALRVLFPEINYAEDKQYSLKMIKLLKNEYFIDNETMYFYLYQSRKIYKKTRSQYYNKISYNKLLKNKNDGIFRIQDYF